MANLVDWARVRWGMGKDVKGNGNTKVRASEAQQKQFVSIGFSIICETF